MKLTIYDYKNNAVEVKIPAKTIDDIEVIDITVLSGDELTKVYLKNGDTFIFEASDCRVTDYHDGYYSVRGSEKIKQWLEFKPTYGRTASYERLDIFE